MGKFRFAAARGHNGASGALCTVYIETKGDKLAPQVGFGSEQGIDSIGSYWFYCNASNVFGQKSLVCTTDLSHVTDFRQA